MFPSLEQVEKEIGKIVRGSREECLMSQAGLATAMRERGFKWSQATVWSVETGERQLRLTEASVVAELCGFDPVMFFGNNESTQANGRFAEGVRHGMELSIAAIRKVVQ